jgi:hypothetical protein
MALTGLSPAELNTLVTSTLALASTSNIPDGHKGALVAVADGQGLKIAVASKVGPDGSPWVVQAYVDHEWSGANRAGVTIMRTW